ncbi:MAG: hypothetical protein ACI3VZ_08320 [Faecousia sp.]
MQEESNVQVVITKNAIIRIHHPILTEEERARRMKAIEQAAIRLAIANLRAEALKERNSAQSKDAEQAT